MLVDPNYVSNLAAMVDQSSAAEASLTTELSSGLRVASLQDDPSAVAQSMLLNGAISRDDTFVQSATSEQSLMQVTDSALGEVVTQVTNALTLAVQGSNGTLDGANLATVQQQLSGIRDQVLSLANTSYLGQYVFGGSVGSTAPYSIDSSTTPATVNYAGDSSVQTISTPGWAEVADQSAGVVGLWRCQRRCLAGTEPVDFRSLRQYGEREHDGRYRRADHGSGAAIAAAQRARQLAKPHGVDQHLYANPGDATFGAAERAGGGRSCHRGCAAFERRDAAPGAVERHERAGQ